MPVFPLIHRLVLALGLVGLATTGAVAQTRPSADEIASVKARLAPIQVLSFATDREYCGYMGHLPDGQRVFTEMVRGAHDGCTPRMPGRGVRLRASLHTHGAYDPAVPAEFPTVRDMDSDAREGVNGYVATPGGRLWYIDSATMVTFQICGEGCLPQDPRFRSGDDGNIRTRYTRDQLQRVENAN